MRIVEFKNKKTAMVLVPWPGALEAEMTLVLRRESRICAGTIEAIAEANDRCLRVSI